MLPSMEAGQVTGRGGGFHRQQASFQALTCHSHRCGTRLEIPFPFVPFLHSEVISPFVPRLGISDEEGAVAFLHVLRQTKAPLSISHNGFSRIISGKCFLHTPVVPIPVTLQWAFQAWV